MIIKLIIHWGRMSARIFTSGHFSMFNLKSQMVHYHKINVQLVAKTKPGSAFSRVFLMVSAKDNHCISAYVRNIIVYQAKTSVLSDVSAADNQFRDSKKE